MLRRNTRNWKHAIRRPGQDVRLFHYHSRLEQPGLTTPCLTAWRRSAARRVLRSHRGGQSLDGRHPCVSGRSWRRCQTITNNDNLGFAKACNQAQAGKGEYLVFLNNDTIPQAGWLSALVEEVKPIPMWRWWEANCCTEDGTIQHAGVASREFLMPHHMYPGVPADAPLSRDAAASCNA